MLTYASLYINLTSQLIGWRAQESFVRLVELFALFFWLSIAISATARFDELNLTLIAPALHHLVLLRQLIHGHSLSWQHPLSLIAEAATLSWHDGGQRFLRQKRETFVVEDRLGRIQKIILRLLDVMTPSLMRVLQSLPLCFWILVPQEEELLLCIGLGHFAIFRILIWLVNWLRPICGANLIIVDSGCGLIVVKGFWKLVFGWTQYLVYYLLAQVELLDDTFSPLIPRGS